MLVVDPRTGSARPPHRRTGRSPRCGPRTLPRRSFLHGAGVMLGAAAVAACSGPRSGEAAGDRFRVVDQRGVQVDLRRPVERIVTIVIPAASMVIALDGGPGRLAGMNSSAAAAVRESILGEIFPQALAIPGDVAGRDFAPNVESIVGLDPDVVVQWGDRGDDLIAPVENAGLSVIGLTYGTQEDLEAWITLFGAVLDKPDRATALLDRMRGGLTAMRATAASTPAPRPRVLYFNQIRGGLKAGGRDTYIDFAIDLVGGTNPATVVSGMTTIDPEQVVAWDPDVILVGNFDDATPAEDVYAVPAWQGVSAVRSRRVYKMPLGGYRWDPPCQESSLMWTWLRAVAFPGTGAAATLRGDMTELLRFLYAHELTPQQTDRILWTDLNATSTGYDQFRG